MVNINNITGTFKDLDTNIVFELNKAVKNGEKINSTKVYALEFAAKVDGVYTEGEKSLIEELKKQTKDGAEVQIPQLSGFTPTSSQTKFELKISNNQGVITAALSEEDEVANLREAGKNLHNKAQKIIYGKENVDYRLNQVPATLKGYKDLGQKIDNSISEINKKINEFETKITNVKGPEKAGLEEQKKSLINKKTELIVLQADFALAQAIDASGLGREENFNNRRATVQGLPREKLFNEAIGDLSKTKNSLENEIKNIDSSLTNIKAELEKAIGQRDTKTANLGEFARKHVKSLTNNIFIQKYQSQIKELESKKEILGNSLGYINETSKAIGKDKTYFDSKVGEANRLAMQRSVVLGNLGNELNGLVSKEFTLSGTDKKYDLSTIITLANTDINKNPELKNNALKTLEQVKKSLLEKVNSTKEQYSNLSPTKVAVDILGQFAKKIETYDFSKMDDINNFGEQVKHINTTIRELFKQMNADGLTRKPEKQILENIDIELTDLENLDLNYSGIQANLFNVLDIGERKSISQLIDIAGVADSVVENNGKSDKNLGDLKGKLLEDLEKTRKEYGIWLNIGTDEYAGNKKNDSSRAPKYDMDMEDHGGIIIANKKENSSDEIYQVLKLLETRTKKLKPGTAVDVSAIDKQIDSLLKNAKDSNHNIQMSHIQNLVNQNRALGNILNYKSRIEDTVLTSSGAIEKANKLAKENPNFAYGIVALDYGNSNKENGYRIVRYDKSALEGKIKLANLEGSNLVFMAGTKDDNVQSGGRLNTGQSKDENFKHGKVNTSIIDTSTSLKDLVTPIPIDKLTSKEFSEQNKILTKVGKKAKEITIAHYDKAIETYKGWKADPVSLIKNIQKVYIDSGRNPDEIEKYLVNMYGVQKFISRGGKESAPSIKFDVLGTDTNDPQSMKKLMETPQYKALMSGLEKRLDNIEEARDDAKDLNDVEASFELINSSAVVRQEVYRHFGFDLRTDKFPPESDGDTVDEKVENGSFNSTAEMVYAYRAEEWDDNETAKGVFKTAGIIIGTIAIGAVTGGLGAGVVGGMAVATATSVGMGMYQVYEAEKMEQKVGAGVSAELLPPQALDEAKKNKAFSYVSMALQAGFGAGSVAIANTAIKTGAISTYKGAMLLDMGVGTLSTAVDPSSYSSGTKGFAFNIVIGGVVSFASNKSSPMKPGNHLDIAFDHNNMPHLKTDDGNKPIKPLEFDEKEGTLKFKVEGDESVYIMKMHTESAEKIPLSRTDIPETNINQKVEKKAPVEVDTKITAANNYETIKTPGHGGANNSYQTKIPVNTAEPAKTNKLFPEANSKITDVKSFEANIQKLKNGEISSLGVKGSDGQTYQVTGYENGMVTLERTDVVYSHVVEVPGFGPQLNSEFNMGKTVTFNPEPGKRPPVDFTLETSKKGNTFVDLKIKEGTIDNKLLHELESLYGKDFVQMDSSDPTRVTIANGDSFGNGGIKKNPVERTYDPGSKITANGSEWTIVAKNEFEPPILAKKEKIQVPVSQLGKETFIIKPKQTGKPSLFTKMFKKQVASANVGKAQKVQDLKGYKFETVNSSANAVEYKVPVSYTKTEVVDGKAITKNIKRDITVIVPEYIKNSQGSNSLDIKNPDIAMKKVHEMLSNTPAGTLDSINRVIIDPQDARKNLSPEMYVHNDEPSTVHISPKTMTDQKNSKNLLNSYFIHESGHTFANNHFGTSMPDSVYHKAVEADGFSSISKYGSTKMEEDFAESVMFYILSNGGTSDVKLVRPEQTFNYSVGELQSKFGNRFQVIGDLMQSNQQFRKEAIAFVAAVIGAAVAGTVALSD